MNRLGMTLKEIYWFIQKDLRKYCEQHCCANVNYIAVQQYYGEEKIVHSISELNDDTVRELLDYVAGQIVYDYLHKETMGKDYIIMIEDIYSDHSVWTVDDIMDERRYKGYMTMKLDPRIIKGKKPLDCFDAEEAENFVGQKGYASDDISTFTDLDFCESGKLEYVVKENGNGICYPYSVVTDYDRKEYAFFLPEVWVQ